MESQFESFFNEIIDKDYQEIIQRAEEEATRAERIFYKEKRMNSEAESYAEMMKNFLFFMRYNVMPSGVDGRTTTFFESISDKLSPATTLFLSATKSTLSRSYMIRAATDHWEISSSCSGASSLFA